MEFDQIYKQYFSQVFLYLRSICVTADLAEELTQETFFKALKAIDTFDGSEDIRAWLFTIAKNTYYSYCRRQKRFADVDSSKLAAAATETSGEMAELLIDSENAFRIHQFLHEMEEPYKEVFNLRVFGELPFEQIGRLFGRSAGWARVTFYRAKISVITYMEVKENGRD